MQLLYCLIPAIKISMYILHSTLCCQIKYCYVVVSRLACVKIDVEVHKMIRECGLVSSINREKLYQIILWKEFMWNIASDQNYLMFTSGEMIFQ